MIQFAGNDVVLDHGGGAWFPGLGILAVADMHLGKSRSAARHGHLLPPWDTQETLSTLSTMMDRYCPATVACLGDTFHDDADARDMSHADRERLSRMASACHFVWIRGNHDRRDGPEPGDHVPGWHSGGVTFMHRATTPHVPCVCGHLHPKATQVTRAGRITRPCFVQGGNVLLLPSVGSYTGGLDLHHPEIQGLFPGGGAVHMLGRDRVFSFPFPCPPTGPSPCRRD